MNWDSKIKKMKVCDIQFIKLSVFFFTLMLAKLWSPLLSLEWYFYGILFILAALKPMVKVFGK